MDYSLVLSEFYSKYAFMLNGNTYEGLNWLDDLSKKPSDEELKLKYNKAIILKKHKLCKNEAKQLLNKTDWSNLSDAQTQLDNYEEFVEYRKTLRNYIINPVENPDFPIEPEARWKV